MTNIFSVDKNLSPFVKDIFILESNVADKNHVLPFFADGCPGLVFYLAENGVFIQPKNKKLTTFFLYGQTIHPIELTVKGMYRLIVFQLYPHVVNYLFGVNPKELNDDCFDVSTLKQFNVLQLINQIKSVVEIQHQVSLISTFLLALVNSNSKNDDDRIRLSINTIIHSKGKISIKELRKQLYIEERTFERKFLSEIGVTPKQFAKIIQFQYSLNLLTEKEYLSLSDVVFNTGFSDQSHFIKTFKKYTGKTPLEFLKKKEGT